MNSSSADRSVESIICGSYDSHFIDLIEAVFGTENFGAGINI